MSKDCKNLINAKTKFYIQLRYCFDILRVTNRMCGILFEQIISILIFDHARMKEPT